ncbi:MAG: hydrogenase maturation protease [Terriglobia bacterium]
MNHVSILIAGVGNIFLGDDAFGVETVRCLSCRANLPEGVRVIDFGIRGLDLAYTLLDGQDDVTILVDASPRGGLPGTLYVIEPNLEESVPEGQPVINPHGMNPMNVLRMVKSMGGQLKRILVVGCEPLTLGSGDGVMGLSQPVAAAVEQAVSLIESLVTKLFEEELPAAASAGSVKRPI